MTGWTGGLIILYHVGLLQADLTGDVGDCLDRLLLADLDFWEEREREKDRLSSPADVSSLYHHRFTNTLQCSSAVQPSLFQGCYSEHPKYFKLN